MQDDETRKLAELIQDIQFAMLSTVGQDGAIHSRPMATTGVDPDAFDGTLWFFTDAESGKVLEVRQDARVNLSYADPKTNTYVSVSGHATVNRDRAKARELWTLPMKAWFPDGADDPKLALLQVDVTQAEYWDMPSSKFVQLVGFTKAVLTGQQYQPGDHARVDLRQ